jgi:phospholipase C
MSLKCPRAAAAVLAVATLLLAVSVPLRADDDSTKTPVKHVVVIFQENISFDHYFGTYPHAEPNADHSVYFKAAADTPRVNGLESSGLLTNNPNANNSANGANAINPFRLDRSQASTCDQNHNYGPEQQAFDQGLMDLFPATVGVGESAFCNVAFSYGKNKGLVMGYFDGNTVTALWNYAQHFAMSDNSYNTTFGPSTPGLGSGVIWQMTPLPRPPQSRVGQYLSGDGHRLQSQGRALFARYDSR